MRGLVCAATVLVALAGCSESNDDPPVATPPSPPAETSSAEP